MSDTDAGYPRVAAPPAHIPRPPQPWAAVPPMGAEEAVRQDGWAADALYQAYERLLAEEKARYRRHMVCAGCLVGLALGHIAFTTIVQFFR